MRPKLLSFVETSSNTTYDLFSKVIDGTNGTFVRKTSPLGSKVTMCRFSGDGGMIIVGLQTGHFKVNFFVPVLRKYTFCKDLDDFK